MLFNLGPFEIAVLVIVALVVFGPERLPELAKDAARMIKTLRELAQGARTQLRDELGPELADLDLRSLNPRVALQKAIFDDDDADDRQASASAPSSDAEPDLGMPVDLHKPVSSSVLRPVEPLGRSEAAPYDDDAT